MAEMGVNHTRRMRVRHRGRGAQIWIYLGKLLRMFVYQNDWKVLPMSALIAGLVGMVIKKRIFQNMEGALLGGFAMVMVAIWNGCFNSIQVICRERDVIKREHRSGMHISSYIAAHMLYQAIICLMQTAVTLYVTKQVGVKYPTEGMFTRWFIVDFGISIFLITYASDMMSLWISTLAHTTTTAMTIMPFVLIFQLVFSGGLLTLPQWAERITPFTISSPALKVIATQGRYNELPVYTLATYVDKMTDTPIDVTFTPGQLMDMLSNPDSATAQEIRDIKIGKILTLGEIGEYVRNSGTYQQMKTEVVLNDLTLGDALKIVRDMEEFKPFLEKKLLPVSSVTLGDIVNLILKEENLKPLLDYKVLRESTVGDIVNAIDAKGFFETYKDMQVGGVYTLGEIADAISTNPDIQAQLNKPIEIKTTMGKLIDLVGSENVKNWITMKAGEASFNPEYEYTADKIIEYWGSLMLFVFIFAALATITLEFIDKDKR